MSAESPYFWPVMIVEQLIDLGLWITLLTLLWKILKEFRRFNAR